MSKDWSAWVGRQEVTQDRADIGAATRWRAMLDSEGVIGSAVPQSFHWGLCLPDAPSAQLGPDGHPHLGGFLPLVDLPRRMWASSAVTFLAPIPLDSAVTRTSTIAAVTQKSGATGQLIFVEVDHNLTIDGQDVVQDHQTIVYREAASVPMASSAPTKDDLDLSAWPWQRSLTPTEPLLFRFSALTFNAHRIHYDLPYTREQEFYPGLVVQGPLTASLLIDLCSRHLGDQTLSSFSFRGMAPAFCGEALHLVGRHEGQDVTLSALGADGRTVMSATATIKEAP
jgi:3-methylfumaryl-CoA hydratase